jgi:hypothetical protein
MYIIMLRKKNNNGDNKAKYDLQPAIAEPTDEAK